jgi:hypothetical protein
MSADADTTRVSCIDYRGGALHVCQPNASAWHGCDFRDVTITLDSWPIRPMFYHCYFQNCRVLVHGKPATREDLLAISDGCMFMGLNGVAA